MPKEKQIGIVKQRLWSSGYKAVERSRAVEGYDLLIEGKVRVIVCRHGEHRRLMIQAENADIVAAVFNEKRTGKDGVVYYREAGDFSSSPRAMFGLPISKNSKVYGTGKKESGKEAS